MFPAALILLALLQDPRAEYGKRTQDLSRYFWEERLTVADWCQKNGLYRESRDLLQFMLLHIPGRHPYKTRAQTRLKGSWTRKPNTATSKKREDYLRRLESYYRSCADRCFELHEFARSHKLDAQAAEALDHTIRYYADHPKAREMRGEVNVAGFGWIPCDEADRVRTRTVLLESADPETLAAEDNRHNDWETAWIVRSPHYLIRGDLPFAKLKGALETLEVLYGELKAFCSGTLNEPATPMGVYYFRNGHDLEKLKATLPGTPENALCFFHGMTNIAYVLSFEGGRVGAIGRTDVELLLHEATHQWIDIASEERVWSIYQQAMSRGDALDNYWIVEGIATYFSTLRMEKGAPVLGREPERLSSVRRWLEEGTLPFLSPFLALDPQEFLRDPVRHYPIAYAFTDFLLHGSEGKHAPAFKTFLREFYLGNSTMETLEKTFGTDLKTLEEEFHAHLKP